MSFPFEWNEFADQPHNVAPKGERFRHHLRHAGSYFSLFRENIAAAVPVLWRYKKLRKKMYRQPVTFKDFCAAAVSPSSSHDRNGEIVELLKATGVRHTLVRLPSWERERLRSYWDFVESLCREGFDVLLALLQNREDVLRPSAWSSFLEEVFSGFSCLASHFEVGHAWNRTKWGVWDHTEYLALASAAVPLAEKFGVTLVGPAVIDFEFHLYLPTLKRIPFDKVSSLLYVDRQGAPEKGQFGWTTANKAALLRAIIDQSPARGKACWVTEVNWPLEGMGECSPASGKPCVSEEDQANFLVRYFVTCLASGFIERIYWWQLAAPGYGLIDTRGAAWRRRPAYFALQTMARHLEGSTFMGKIENAKEEIFLFSRGDASFAVCWTRQGAIDCVFPHPVSAVLGRDGEDIRLISQKIRIEEKPTYVFFR